MGKRIWGQFHILILNVLSGLIGNCRPSRNSCKRKRLFSFFGRFPISEALQEKKKQWVRKICLSLDNILFLFSIQKSSNNIFYL